MVDVSEAMSGTVRQTINVEFLLAVLVTSRSALQESRAVDDFWTMNSES